MDAGGTTEKTGLLIGQGAKKAGAGESLGKPSLSKQSLANHQGEDEAMGQTTLVSDRYFSGSEKDTILFHIVFGIIALVTVITSPLDGLGLRIWALVVGWYAAIVSIALRKKHRDWLLMMNFLFPLCVFFIFPDGFLATGLQTISFPDMGVGQIFEVTSFMPFLWAIPLFISTSVGRGIEVRGVGRCKAALGAGLASLILFSVSEEILTRIPIWYALDNCTKVGHVAIYVLFPEFSLGIVTFLVYQYCSNVSFLTRVFGAFMVMSMYLGNLVACFMMIDGRDKL